MKPSEALRTRDQIEYMLTALERIRDYTASVTLETFQSTRMIVDAVVRNLEIIGEAARNVILGDAAFMNAHPEIPWQDLDAMGNRLSREYFAINAKTVWVSVQNDVPKLERALSHLLQP